jgi:hypothetical protein
MTEVERKAFVFLLIIDFFAILISMVAGPVENDAVAIGAAVSAAIISASLTVYGLYFWKKKER